MRKILLCSSGLDVAIQADQHTVTVHGWQLHEGAKESVTLHLELGIVAWHLWMPFFRAADIDC